MALCLWWEKDAPAPELICVYPFQGASYRERPDAAEHLTRVALCLWHDPEGTIPILAGHNIVHSCWNVQR